MNQDTMRNLIRSLFMKNINFYIHMNLSTNLFFKEVWGTLLFTFQGVGKDFVWLKYERDCNTCGWVIVLVGRFAGKGIK